MNFNFIDSRSVWNEIKGMTFLFDFAHFITNTRSTITLLFSFRIREPIKQFIEKHENFHPIFTPCHHFKNQNECRYLKYYESNDNIKARS